MQFNSLKLYNYIRIILEFVELLYCQLFVLLLISQLCRRSKRTDKITFSANSANRAHLAKNTNVKISSLCQMVFSYRVRIVYSFTRKICTVRCITYNSFAFNSAYRLFSNMRLSFDVFCATNETDCNYYPDCMYNFKRTLSIKLIPGSSNCQ